MPSLIYIYVYILHTHIYHWKSLNSRFCPIGSLAQDGGSGLEAPGCQPPGATERFQPQLALCDAFGWGGSRGGGMHARVASVDDPRSVLRCAIVGNFG